MSESTVQFIMIKVNLTMNINFATQCNMTFSLKTHKLSFNTSQVYKFNTNYLTVIYSTDILTSSKVTNNTSVRTQEVREDVVFLLNDKVTLGTAITLLQTPLDTLVTATHNVTCM